jgi:four helix bundle protein
MQDYRKLAVWKRSHELTLSIYAATGTFPREESFGLTSQLRRAASSVPANIVEGCGRDTNAEFARFLYIALGSAKELEYHLLLAHDLGYLSDEAYTAIIHEATGVKMMLSGLLAQVRGKTTIRRNPRTVNREP